MARYLAEWLFTGEDLPQRDIFSARSDADAIRTAYTIKYFDSYSEQEYNNTKNDDDLSFSQLNVEDCLNALEGDEDTLLFLLNMRTEEYLYEF